jgi:hypothetical protein
MAGYAATARIGRVEPRRVAWPGSAASRGAATTVAVASGTFATAIATTEAAPESVDLSGEPYLEVLSDWVAGLGEAWSQMVFFLFDPESWRA